MDEDLPILNAQAQWHENIYGIWNCTVKPDLLSLRYRQWYDRKSQQSVIATTAPAYAVRNSVLIEG